MPNSWILTWRITRYLYWDNILGRMKYTIGWILTWRMRYLFWDDTKLGRTRDLICGYLLGGWWDTCSAINDKLFLLHQGTGPSLTKSYQCKNYEYIRYQNLNMRKFLHSFYLKYTRQVNQEIIRYLQKWYSILLLFLLLNVAHKICYLIWLLKYATCYGSWKILFNIASEYTTQSSSWNVLIWLWNMPLVMAPETSS